MRRFPALLLILLLFAGCTAHAPLPGAPSTQDNSALSDQGLYDPDSAVEAETHGAVRCYPLGSIPHSGLRALGEGLLLFSHTEDTTVLAKLEGVTAVSTASLELSFLLNAQDTSIHPCGDGLSCFDPDSRETLVIDSQLQIVSGIPAPDDLMGTPVLSRDGSSLYYCTPDAIRVLDITTGISRMLKESAYTTQTVDALLLDDSVLCCRLWDGTRERRLFLSTETGSTLHVSETVRNISTAYNRYHACISLNGTDTWIFGSPDGQPQMLLLPAGDTIGQFLSQSNAAIGIHRASSGELLIEHFDLNTGVRSAALTLHTTSLPQSFTAAAEGGIWFVIYDEQYGCDVLYRWEPSASAVEDSTARTAAYFTPEYPDTEGLEACARLAQTLGEQYGIEILVYDRADDVQPPDYRLTSEHLVPVIQRELKQLEQSLSSYPEGFIQTLASRFESLTICLVRSLAGSSTLGSLESTNGIQFWDGPHAYIALAASSGSEQALYHELCHLIDTIVLTQSSAYDTWNQLNPTGFSYDYDYIANQQRNSTAYLQDSTRYFVDMYSMSFPKEDRARIMEYAMTEGNAHLFQTDAMRAKLETLSRGIREAFGLEEVQEIFLWEQYLTDSAVLP